MAGKLRYDYLSASTKIHNKKCRLEKIIITPDGTNAGYIDVHDGGSANDPKVMRLRVLGTYSFSFDFGKDFILERGLYIVFSLTTGVVTVFSEPAK